jgi:hypothetical protein
MNIERAGPGSSLVDVLDRVLDKGIVVDAWVRVSIVGIDLVTVEARVIIASIDTYIRYAGAVGALPTVAQPQVEATRGYAELTADNLAMRAQLEDGRRTTPPPVRAGRRQVAVRA